MGRFRGQSEVVAAFSAELELGWIGEITFRTDSFQFGSAFPAKLLTLRILILALRALHEISPSEVRCIVKGLPESDPEQEH